MLSNDHIDAFKNITGPKGIITGADEIAPHVKEWRGKFFGKTDLMLAPATTDQVSQIVSYCNDHKIALVPQGGNTGVVGGGIPGLEGRNEVLITTKRMNKNIVVDADDYSIIVDAGCTIQSVQDAAAEQDRLFPLSLASEGSCTAGGVVSTNAGGVHVLRYGTTRALTVGIEAVLPNGQIYSDLSSLRKDNTGYALNQLLIGAEGTLGIITKVAFRLYPMEKQRYTYWLGIDSPATALKLLSSAREITGDRVSVFEILPELGLSLVLNNIPDTAAPLTAPYPWYVLMEVATTTRDNSLQLTLDTWLEAMMQNGLLLDGAEAQSEAQRKAFWKLRESMSEAQKYGGGSIKHDISVPVSHVPVFIEQTFTALEKHFPKCRPMPFGHLGDGNLHFNVLQPEGTNKEDFLSEWSSMNALVHDIVTEHKGSISAEHGIGTLKREELARLKDPAALAAMRTLKAALDPNNIMNPGVLFK